MDMVSVSREAVTLLPDCDSENDPAAAGAVSIACLTPTVAGRYDRCDGDYLVGVQSVEHHCALTRARAA